LAGDLPRAVAMTSAPAVTDADAVIDTE